MVVLLPVVISNGLRAAAVRRSAWNVYVTLAAPTTTVRFISSLHAYSYIQQSGRSVKSTNAKNPKKSPIHDNVVSNITCDFGDGDISCFRSRLPHTRIHGHTVAHTRPHR